MSTSWQIGGVDLDTASVRVTMAPMSLKADQASRIQQEPRLHALARRHVLGRDLPVYGFRFTFIGPEVARTARMNYVRNVLRGTPSWLLTAPDAPNEVYFNEAVKEISLTMVSMSVVYMEGLSAIALDVVAIEPAPEDSAPGGEGEEEGGLTRGVAQVFTTVCMPILEETLFAVSMRHDASGNPTENTIPAEGVLQEDSGNPSEETIPVDGMLQSEAAPVSEQVSAHQP